MFNPSELNLDKQSCVFCMFSKQNKDKKDKSIKKGWNILALGHPCDGKTAPDVRTDLWDSDQYVLMLVMLIELCHGYLSISLCHGYHISYQVVHWRAPVFYRILQYTASLA